MKTTQKPVIMLSWLIVALSLIAAGSGVVTGVPGQGNGNDGHYDVLTLRGQTVQMWGGSGLYRFDAVAGASQEIAQDIVTLFIGVPLLIAASVLATRGSLRGKLLLAGTLGYFLYTYTAMSTLTAYNELFLVYVGLMSLSLFGFVLALTSIDIAALPARFSSTFPRRIIAGFALFLGAMLILLWLKLIVPPLLAGTPPDGLYSYTTLVIQAMDLGFIAPAAILTGILLLRREPLGFLLSSVVLILGFTMGAALLAMSVGQILAGVQVDAVTVLIFTALSTVDMGLTAWLLRSIVEVSEPGHSVPDQKAPLVTTA